MPVPNTSQFATMQTPVVTSPPSRPPIQADTATAVIYATNPVSPPTT